MNKYDVYTIIGLLLFAIFTERTDLDETWRIKMSTLETTFWAFTGAVIVWIAYAIVAYLWSIR